MSSLCDGAPPRLTVCDFFCGAGGFSEGFYQEGFDIRYALDIWKPAYITHEYNHPACINKCHDIMDLDTPEKIDQEVPDTDIIIGSPPCVSFSNSNKSGTADKTLGCQLIHQFLKIVLYKKNKLGSRLKYWIMENVPNSLAHIHENNRYTAAELGLDASFGELHITQRHILVASEYGSPQGRKRAIVGDYIVPTKTKDTVVPMDVILKALGPPLGRTPQDLIIDPSFPWLQMTADKVSDHFYDGELPPDWVEKARRLKTDHGYMGKMDFPDRTDRLCRTIMATESYCSRESIIFAKEGTSTAKEGTSSKYRAPTIRELACFMGFPIDYQFIGTTSTSKHKQIGNAVCVHMSMALARAIREKENIPLVPPPRRELVPFDAKLNINLNDLKTPLFANHVCAKEKKMNSKFHVHVPHLKIHQLRVELDNITSDFTNEQYVWRCLLHRGAGKGAKSTAFTAEQCRAILSSHPSFADIQAFLEEEIRPRMLNSQAFQEKNCNLVSAENERQLSPMELLEAISIKVKSMGLQNERLCVDTLDQQLEYSKKNEYSVEVLFALYMVNVAVSFLVEN